MKTINQLKIEIKRDGYADARTTNIELYRRLYGEVRERVNTICFAPVSDEFTDRDIAFELFHIIDAFSFSTGAEFSRADFAEDLKAHIFSMSGRYSDSYAEWLAALSAGSEDLL